QPGCNSHRPGAAGGAMKAGICSFRSFRASRWFAGLTRQWKNQPLRVVRFLRLLLLFWVTAIAVGRDSFLDSLADFLAPLAHTLTQILPCRDGFALLHLVADSFATPSHIFAGGFEIASDRLRPHSQFACCLGIKVSRDRQI